MTSISGAVDVPSHLSHRTNGICMRVFSAALAIETNTFAPMPTGLSSFHERAYYPAGQHPDAMQMHGGPLWAARLVGPARGWTLIEGLAVSYTHLTLPTKRIV